MEPGSRFCKPVGLAVIVTDSRAFSVSNARLLPSYGSLAKLMTLCRFYDFSNIRFLSNVLPLLQMALSRNEVWKVRRPVQGPLPSWLTQGVTHQTLALTIRI